MGRGDWAPFIQIYIGIKKKKNRPYIWREKFWKKVPTHYTHFSVFHPHPLLKWVSLEPLKTFYSSFEKFSPPHYSSLYHFFYYFITIVFLTHCPICKDGKSVLNFESLSLSIPDQSYLPMPQILPFNQRHKKIFTAFHGG